MSLTNDQITAKNFKEFYEAIRPYLNGSFPTAIANKFDKANMYSTDEQIVGRWIDGKPLYQKTFTIASMQKDGYEDVLTGVDYAQTIAKTYRRMQDGVDGDDFWYTSSAYVNVRATCMDDGTLRITNCSSVSPLTDIILTAQYTKTTDTAMDIGSDTDYSTTEKIIGTWIDGKPLYQKTIVFDNVQSATDGNLVHNIPNVDYISISDASYKLNQLYMTAYCDAIENGSLSANFSYSFVCQHADATKIRYQCGANRSGGTLYITIQYTKTTD